MNDISKKEDLLKHLETAYASTDSLQHYPESYGINPDEPISLSLDSLLRIVEAHRLAERVDCAEIAFTLINSRSYSNALAEAVVAHIMRKQ